MSPDSVGEGDVSSDRAAWVALWHATGDAIIVGHAAGSACPYRVGHSLREHCWHIAPTVEARFQEIIDAGLHGEPVEHTP